MRWPGALAALLALLAPALAATGPAKKPSVEVFGDRLGTTLAAGLAEADTDVTVVYATSDAAELSGPNYAEWLRTLRDRLARPARPDAALIMVGERDRGPLVEGATRLEPGTAAWTAALGARIDAVARLFAEARVPLVWVGLPPVRNPEASAGYSRIDGLLRDHAAGGGAQFVDVWSGFTDDAGNYRPDGPDAEGNPARLRRGDGFTSAGARKLASYAVPALSRVLGQKRAPGADLASLTIERARDFDAALSIDVNAQIRREAARETAPATGRPSSPAAGPILPLTAGYAPAGAELAALPAAGASFPASPLVDAGAVTPEPGRADDFSWPKPGNPP